MMRNDNKMIKNLRKVTKFIWSYDKKYIFLSILTIIIEGVTPSLLLLLMQKIINKIQIQESLKTILVFVFIYLAVDLGREIYDNFVNYYNSKFEKKFELHISNQLFQKAKKLTLSDYENSNTYNVINRAQNEGGNRIISFYMSYIKIITSIVTIITYIAILISFKYWIVFIIIIIPICKFFIENKYNKAAYNIIYNRTNEQRKTWYINYLLTYGKFYKEIKTFNLFGYFINKYTTLIDRFNKQDLKLLKSKSIVIVLLSILEGLIDGALFIFVIILGIRGEILLGNLLTYLNVIISSKNSMTNILMNISQSIRESLFIEQLFEYFKMPEEDNTGKIEIDRIEKIELINVSYKYQNTDKYVLKNIGFKIENSKKVALIGMNGSGKTTLIKLIMGFYDNYEGTILINDINLNDIDKRSILQKISTLFQDYIRFENTFKENIGYGDFSIMDDEKKLVDIIERFGFKEMIDGFPNGVDTQLGNWFDNGINISNGQWQKIAVARIFGKMADVYILDEPNSAMDSITEKEVLSACDDILQNKMGIIITHKFSNIVESVDEIVVLENGVIKERGKSIDLLKLKGLYYELYNKYRDK